MSGESTHVELLLYRRTGRKGQALHGGKGIEVAVADLTVHLDGSCTDAPTALSELTEVDVLENVALGIAEAKEGVELHAGDGAVRGAVRRIPSAFGLELIQGRQPTDSHICDGHVVGMAVYLDLHAIVTVESSIDAEVAAVVKEHASPLVLDTDRILEHSACFGEVSVRVNFESLSIIGMELVILEVTKRGSRRVDGVLGVALDGRTTDQLEELVPEACVFRASSNIALEVVQWIRHPEGGGEHVGLRDR
mmetsp:Transcript_16090/g.46344  ORF Transcript_16090/g.46344 Transcript_16090/m.46344 type:complete len:250 (+) Transcript_16090:2376-3125(+)